MSTDSWATIIGSGSFVVFLATHLVLFRKIKPEAVLKTLMYMMISFLSLPIILAGLAGVWAASVPALVIHTLLCFIYVICVFGFYEASIRLRLIREIAKSQSQGLSVGEILSNYDVDMIVSIRLQRLLGSGDVVEKEGFYYLGRKAHFFTLLDTITAMLKK